MEPREIIEAADRPRQKSQLYWCLLFVGIGLLMLAEIFVLGASCDSGQTIEQHIAGKITSQADYYLWSNHHWFDLEGAKMTANLCEEMKDTTFVAFRFPDAYTQPVVFRGVYTPILTLQKKFPPTDVFSVPLEYKPQHQAFMNSELPSAEGEHWLALGVSSPASINCSSVLTEDIEAGNWEFRADFWLDFGGVQGTCADCVLPFYFCYEGTEAPPFFTGLSQALGEGVSATSYQGWGITAMGPQSLRLMEGWNPPDARPPFDLMFKHHAYISPTRPISFLHSIRLLGNDPVTATLDFTSTLGLTWQMYSGTWVKPDTPLVPISGPIALKPGYPDNERIFWMMTDVPTGTQGTEMLRIIATSVTSADLSIWTSDIVWFGKWTVPPGKGGIYLPVILKDY